MPEPARRISRAEPSASRGRRGGRALRAAALVLALLPAAADAELTRPAPAGAAPDPRAPSAVDIYWENDGTLLKPNHNTDRNYTNGNAVTLSHHPAWAAWLHDRLPFRDAFDDPTTAAGYVLGHQMFTPDDTERREPDPSDRPYAGYLYGGAYWQRADARTLDHLELNIGVIGPVAEADDLQRIIHDLRGITKPRGWDAQLDNEPTLQLFLRRKGRLRLAGPRDRGGGWALEVIPQGELAVGTVRRHVEGELLLRAGINLPDDFGPGAIDDLASATGAPRRGWGGYGFASVAGRFVEHNTFLKGNNFESSPAVDAEPLLGRARVGVALSYRGPRWSAELAWSQQFRTDAFESQNTGHSFGQLKLSLRGRF